MSLERVARLRDEVRGGLRPGAFLTDPLDGAMDRALREGLWLLTPYYPLHTVRFTVAAEALVDGTLLDVAAVAPDLQQLVTVWWPLDAPPADYMPIGDGRRVLFQLGSVPAVGDLVEITYRRVLTVTGLDGAVTTTFSSLWDPAWVKAAVYWYTHAELTRVANLPNKQAAAAELNARALLIADRRARVELDEMIAGLLRPVRPVTWQRGL